MRSESGDTQNPSVERIYLIEAVGRAWTLCREDDPNYVLGSFDSEERAIQAARYLARHVSGGRVRVIHANGDRETKYRHQI